MTSRRRYVAIPMTVAELLADMRSHPAVICVHSYAAAVEPLGICSKCEMTLRTQGWRGRA